MNRGAPNPVWEQFTGRQRWVLLITLFLVGTSNTIDRAIISVVLEPIKAEFGVSDTMLGLLSGAAFAVLYATLGIPVARWADRGNRRTIIVLATAVWSAFTLLCGVAQTFWQLALARVGVGVGEAGGTPPSQSLIADYFAPERRASALAFFGLNGVIGYIVGFAVGAWIAVHYGWRMLFILAGAPGLVLALLAWLLIKEPRDLSVTATSARQIEAFGPTLKHLLTKRSYVYLVIGITAYSLVAYGALLFIPPYLVRVLHQPLDTSAGLQGLISAVSAILGSLSGGVIADRLGKRDIRWIAWMPALACLVAGPLYVTAFVVPSMTVYLVAAFAAGTLLSFGLPPAFACLHMVCGSARRAVAVAIALFCSNLIGMGLGPVITGAISDALAPRFGPESLRWAMVTMCTLMLLVAWCFARAGSMMANDLEA